MPLSHEQQEKLQRLRSFLRESERVVVAFSGGVDSTLLLALAYEELGQDAIAVTNKSVLVPDREFAEARDFCLDRGMRHFILESDELSIPEVKANAANRCYVCKKMLFGEIVALAKEWNCNVVVEGSNVDDCSDYRPGFKAVEELGVVSPLLECGLTKQDIRDISQSMGLPTWNKQSFACLASRFPYGDEITLEGLKMVGDAEQFLIDLGVSYSRVRIHESLARIEVVADDFEKVVSHREEIAQRFKEIGFAYSALDLTGYRTGSMNEVL